MIIYGTIGNKINLNWNYLSNKTNSSWVTITIISRISTKINGNSFKRMSVIPYGVVGKREISILNSTMFLQEEMRNLNNKNRSFCSDIDIHKLSHLFISKNSRNTNFARPAIAVDSSLKRYRFDSSISSIFLFLTTSTFMIKLCMDFLWFLGNMDILMCSRSTLV